MTTPIETVNPNWLDEFLSVVPKSEVKPEPIRVKLEEKHYWRCPDCLSVCATVGPLNKMPRDPQWHGSGPGVKCALCAVRLEYMGQVAGSGRWLNKTQEICACNEKCQSATGPNCSCSCGGKNHGEAVLVTIVVSTSAIPEITPIDDKAQVRRDEYHAAYEAAKNRIQWAYNAMQRRRNGEYLSDSIYWPARAAIEALGKADARAQHGPRLKALAKIV